MNTSWAVHRDASSHSTKPHAYISMRRNASLEKFMAPSNTSGAIYLRVPTYDKKRYKLINYNWTQRDKDTLGTKLEKSLECMFYISNEQIHCNVGFETDKQISA